MAHESSYSYFNTPRDGTSEHSVDMYTPRRFNTGRMDPPPPPIDPQLEQWPPIDRSHDTSFQDLPFLSSSAGAFEAMPRDILESTTRPADMESDPMRRFWNTPGPWTSHRAVGQGPSAPRYITTAYNSVTRPSASFNVYRDSPRSDPGSHLTDGRPDSGYATKSHVTPSVFSADYADQSHETQSLTGDIHNIQLQQEYMPGPYHRDSLDSQSGGYDHPGHDHPDSAAPMPLKCPQQDCSFVPKNQSEHKKHLQRHNKPFVCQEPNCARPDGFTTRNDLERHKKAVHHIIPSNGNDRSFKCLGINCSKKDKIWPRLDNFKSHCKRIHPKEDIDELVKKSEIDSQQGSISTLTGAGPSSLRRSESDATSTRGISIARSFPHELQAKRSASDIIKAAESPPMFNGTKRPGRADIIRNSKMADEESKSTSPYEQTSWQSQPSPKRDNHDDALHRLDSQQPIMQSTGSPRRNEFLAEQLRQSDAVLLDLVGSSTQAEELSKAIAADVSNCLNMSQSSPQEIESIIRSRILSLLNPASTRKRTREDACLSPPAQPKSKRVTCSICAKTMDRPCDLKKHEKRHTRPWGCTHTTCTKTFGSKNDWKRHENSQHYQLETWRCPEPNATSKINQCARLFYRRDPFQVHLRKDHDIEDEEHIREQCKRGRIGRNGQSGFWCGFCKEIIKLNSRGLDASDERFNHIDDMHFKKGKGIEDWYPLDKDVPKGLLKGENFQKSGGFSARYDSDSEESDIAESRGRKGRHHGRPSPPPSPPPPPAPASSSPPFESGEQMVGRPPKASRLSRADSPRWKQRANLWYCCKCQQGPHNQTIMVFCVEANCGHRFCPSCPRADDT